MNTYIRSTSVSLFLLGLMLFVSGCGNELDRSSRPENINIVPEHPLLVKFRGTWNDEMGDEHLRIITLSGQFDVIQAVLDETWDYVINNVRFEGDDLKFDLYKYYLGTTDNYVDYSNAGNHPEHGACKSITLMFFEDDQSRLKMLVSNKTESTTIFLTRSEK